MNDEVYPSGSALPFTTYRYALTPVEEINLSLKAVLTNQLSLIHVSRRNELDHKTIERTYGLNYSKQCWTIEIKYTETTDDKGVSVAFSLYGLGKVGGK